MNAKTAIVVLISLLFAWQPAMPAEDFGATGSDIRISGLTARQVEDLHLLGRVWGFLKYHHPQVTSGRVPWDAELLRVLPRVLEARDSTEAQTRIVEWIDSLGEVSRCNPCAELSPERLQLAPRREWLDDPKVAGDTLRQRLRTILANRVPDQQHYVSLAPNAGNPSFDNEPDYARAPLPDAGFQLLALFRLWSAVEYWFPYRSLIEPDWTQTLREFIPRIAQASTRDDFQLELMALIARIGDSHANLWSSVRLRPPAGACQLPVNVRFIEGLPVIASYSGSPGPFRLGDVLDRLDGNPVREQIERWRPYYAASNDWARSRDIGRGMTRGQCGATSVVVQRDGREHELQAERVPTRSLNMKTTDRHDLAGPAFRLLSPSVAYLKISAIKADEIPASIEAARNTQAMIVDLRGYPTGFVVFQLAGHFLSQPTAFARFTIPDRSNPGAFNWMEPLLLPPMQPHYRGQLFVLVDEAAQSAAEYVAMSLRAAPRSMLVGSPTAGADGNVSRLPLPGGLWALISGIGVYYPDKRPTQRIGIQPDLLVRPTVNGIRQDQDEVLAAALRLIVRGADAEKQIAELSKRSTSSAQEESFDLLIKNARVVDGSGAAAYRADVAVRGDAIVRIAPEIDGHAKNLIDAGGKVIAPGFIDVHVHARDGIFNVPTADNYVRQGVTTLIEGPDGGSPLPVGEFLDRIAKTAIAPNVGLFVGQGSVRESVMGAVDRRATPAELDKMRDIVRRSMTDGAFGLSTGLFYVPGAFTPTEELVELAKVAGQMGGMHISHMRDEATRVLDSVRETIEIGAKGGLPTQVTHHKIIGALNWGKSVDTLRLVDEARARGVDVTIDQYPYTASSTSIHAALLPKWANEGGRARMLERLQDASTRARIRAETIRLIKEERGGGDPANVQVSSCEWDPSLAGKRLNEVTSARQLAPTVENAADTVLWMIEQGECLAIFHAIDEQDLQRILKHPSTMIASDGSIPVYGRASPHPRSYGAFVRVLGHYVRDLKVITLEDAVRKMSGLPAKRLGLADRGLLQEGLKADLVIFDPDTVRDQATYELPHQYAEGVSLVVINGQVVFENGRMTAARPGRVLYGPTRERRN